jgi:hypothetical protein
MRIREINVTDGSVMIDKKKKEVRWESNDKNVEVLFDLMFYRVITRNNEKIDLYRIEEEMDKHFIEEWIERTLQALN